MATATHNATDVLTTPGMASLAGVPLWQLQSAMRRRFIEPPRKIGPQFLWHAADLPRVVAGLRAAGYLPPDPSGDPA